MPKSPTNLPFTADSIITDLNRGDPLYYATSFLLSHHNPFLVILSYVIASISAYASIDLARRVIFSSGTGKVIWLVTGGATLGIGIWSMHFIAMLAHRFPVPVSYSAPLVAISVVFSAVACIIGYYLISMDRQNRLRFISAGVIMGAGIASMHYAGTEAIRPLLITYDWKLVTLSVMIAIFASLAALWVGFLSPYATKEMSWRVKLAASLIMAGAIASMHYIGMKATTFTEKPGIQEFSEPVIHTTLLAWIIGIVTLLIFSLFFFSIIGERLLRKQATVQNAILDSSSDGIVITDKAGQIIHANPAFHQFMNSSGFELKWPVLSAYHPLLNEEAVDDSFVNIEARDRIFEVRKRDVQSETLKQSLWTFRDITEAVHDKQRIESMAFLDSLTNLPNRHRLDAILHEWTEENRQIGCILLNIDRLKFVNDTLGLQAGDVLLKKVSRILEGQLQDGDFLARVGGDEFIVLVSGVRTKELQMIADQALQTVQHPFEIQNVPVHITMSAGICSYPELAGTADELLQYADLAVSKSKADGKNQATVFNVAIKEQHRRRLELEDALSTALENDEFHLHYQPKVMLATGNIVGAEALLRWSHPVLGTVSPMEFIPVAEEKGMIHEIGLWVLRESCTQWKEWADKLPEPIILAVNLSPLQLSKDDFLYHLLRIIEETDMDPSYLELEITESASLAFETGEILQRVCEFGIQISLDDFGTGYSSFSQLRELPIHVLKIDKSFLVNLLGNKGQEAIVRSIIQLGHNLGLKVIMEGVEQAEEAQWLKKEGCDVVQGYFFFKPLPPDQLFNVLLPQFTPQM